MAWGCGAKRRMGSGWSVSAGIVGERPAAALGTVDVPCDHPVDGEGWNWLLVAAGAYLDGRSAYAALLVLPVAVFQRELALPIFAIFAGASSCRAVATLRRDGSLFRSAHLCSSGSPQRPATELPGPMARQPFGTGSERRQGLLHKRSRLRYNRRQQPSEQR